MSSLIKKICVGVLIAVVAVLLMVGIDFYRITEFSSRRDLGDYGTASCYIAFNVENNGKTYKIVSPNAQARDFIIRQKNEILAFAFLYPVYMDKIIQFDWNVSVDDSLFSHLEYSIVNEEGLKRLKDKDIRSDTSLLTNLGTLRYDIPAELHNACIYELLRQEYFLCVNCYSGSTHVSAAPAH